MQIEIIPLPAGKKGFETRNTIHGVEVRHVVEGEGVTRELARSILTDLVRNRQAEGFFKPGKC